MELHQQGSPFVKKARALRLLNKPQKGHKLTSTQVMLLKKKIFDPNRKTRLKFLAKQFGISEMQLYRIKSGENWSHVKIED
jgi:predicted DNA binding protein